MGSVTFRKVYFQMQLYPLKPCVSLGYYTFSSEHLSEGGCEMNHQLLEVTQVPPLTRKYLMKLQAQVSQSLSSKCKVDVHYLSDRRSPLFICCWRVEEVLRSLRFHYTLPGERENHFSSPMKAIELET